MHSGLRFWRSCWIQRSESSNGTLIRMTWRGWVRELDLILRLYWVIPNQDGCLEVWRQPIPIAIFCLGRWPEYHSASLLVPAMVNPYYLRRWTTGYLRQLSSGMHLYRYHSRSQLPTTGSITAFLNTVAVRFFGMAILKDAAIGILLQNARSPGLLDESGRLHTMGSVDRLAHRSSSPENTGFPRDLDWAVEIIHFEIITRINA